MSKELLNYDVLEKIEVGDNIAYYTTWDLNLIVRFPSEKFQLEFMDMVYPYNARYIIRAKDFTSKDVNEFPCTSSRDFRDGVASIEMYEVEPYGVKCLWMIYKGSSGIPLEFILVDTEENVGKLMGFYLTEDPEKDSKEVWSTEDGMDYGLCGTTAILKGRKLMYHRIDDLGLLLNGGEGHVGVISSNYTQYFEHIIAESFSKYAIQVGDDSYLTYFDPYSIKFLYGVRPGPMYGYTNNLFSIKDHDLEFLWLQDYSIEGDGSILLMKTEEDAKSMIQLQEVYSKVIKNLDKDSVITLAKNSSKYYNSLVVIEPTPRELGIYLTDPINIVWDELDGSIEDRENFLRPIQRLFPMANNKQMEVNTSEIVKLLKSKCFTQVYDKKIRKWVRGEDLETITLSFYRMDGELVALLQRRFDSMDMKLNYDKGTLYFNECLNEVLNIVK